jgi:hypothetical protein
MAISIVFSLFCARNFDRHVENIAHRSETVSTGQLLGGKAHSLTFYCVTATVVLSQWRSATGLWTRT